MSEESDKRVEWFGWVVAILPWALAPLLITGVPEATPEGAEKVTTTAHVLGVVALYLGWVGLLLRGPWWFFALHLRGFALRGLVEVAGWVTLCVLSYSRVHAYVEHFGTFGPGGGAGAGRAF